METLPGKVSLQVEQGDFFWEVLPGVFSKFSNTLGNALTDGQYLTSFIKRTYLFPPILFLIGLFIGANHFGFDKDYVDTMSATLVIFMLALSVWGAAFGFWLWLGYAFGELFIYSYHEFINSSFFDGSASLLSETGSFAVHYFLPKVILCALLYFLLVLTPVIVNNLRVKILGYQNLKLIDKAILNIVLYAAIFGFIAFCWAKSVPPLVSPIYNWRGQDCPHPPLQSIFINIDYLVAAAAILGFARFYFEFIKVKPHQNISKIYELPISFKDVNPFSVSKMIRTVFGSAFTAFMLCGLMLIGDNSNGDNYLTQAWHLGFITLFVVFAIYLFRIFFSASALGKKWTASVQYVPFFIRIVIVWGVALFFANIILAKPFDATDPVVRSDYMTYMLISIFISMFFWYLLLPDLGIISTVKPVKSLLNWNKSAAMFFLLMAMLFTSTIVLANKFCVQDPSVYVNPPKTPKEEIPKTTTAIALSLTLAAFGALKIKTNSDGSLLITIDSKDTTSTIMATAHDGTPGYDYSWTNDKTGESGTDSTITNLKPGTYSVTVTDSTGKSVTKQAVVKDAVEDTETISGGNPDDVG